MTFRPPSRSRAGCPSGSPNDSLPGRAALTWTAMCGIVGVVRRPSRREPPIGSGLVGELDAALAALGAGEPAAVQALQGAAGLVEEVDRLLRGVPGVLTLLGDRAAAVAIEDRAQRLGERLALLELELDVAGAPPDELEARNEILVRAKDALWAVQ